MKNLGPYKLEAVLGRGGMGTVYRATNCETGGIEAVKVLAPVYSNDEHFRNRFESEIKALIKLDHPNIVRLISYGQNDNNLYFAMELVEGKSLFQLQRSGPPFHWREVIRICKNIALGLRHAHDRGVIHRDLKPGNLLKADTGIVKITDFGIAKNFGQSQDTGTNVLGTVDFMSPEQAKGQPVTIRSDLYSLGTVMYTLLAGKPPFTANSVEESMRNLTRVPAPKISRIAPDVPQPLEDLIAHLLEKDPEERVPTALSLYHQLKQIEQKLRDDSQAKTAELPSVSTAEMTSVDVGSVTNVDAFSQAANTVNIEENSDRHTTDSGRELTDSTGDLSNAGGTANTGPSLKKADDQSEDFFNTVTDDERQEHLEIRVEESEPSSAIGKLVLSGLLALVLCGAAYGIYVANQIPSADALILRIEESWDTPQKRMAEIQKFVTNYQGHDRFDEIREREYVARAFQKVHQLRARSKGTAKLSEVELGFMSIFDSSRVDAPKAVEQLRALMTLYQDQQGLEENDTQCIEVARDFMKPLTDNAVEQLGKVRSNIENQLQRAKTLPEAEALDVYDSIVELNEQFEWASDLIQEARDRADVIRNL